jgi:hypothetical protein
MKIPINSEHYRMPVLQNGYLNLNPIESNLLHSEEWEKLEYVNFKSGGDTKFAPITSGDGGLNVNTFLVDGRADKDGTLTNNSKYCPTLMNFLNEIPANYGRVRVIMLNTQDHELALKSLHRDDNNRFNSEDSGYIIRFWIELTDNPESYMLLYSNGVDQIPDPKTEKRIYLKAGTRYVIDSQKLWHVVVHKGTSPRYAMIISMESSPELNSWIIENSMNFE